MNLRFFGFALALLPVCLLSAQQPNSQAPQLPPNASGFHSSPHQPSPEAMRRIAEERRLMQEHANAINDLAGNIQSPDDARKLVNLVADEFSKELPPRWMTHGIRERIARAEYAAAAEPRGLIPEQHVADAWNDFLQKIGAPPETYVTAAEIHWLRDSYYVTAQLSWARGNQNVWTVSKIYAVGPDGKVADGCRALEVLNILWMLGNHSEVLTGTREQMKKGERMSDMYKHPSVPPKPGAVHSYVTARVAPPNPIWMAANSYVQAHGERAFEQVVEGLLRDLFQ